MSVFSYKMKNLYVRCEEQMGEQFMGEEADCAKEESLPHWLWQVQGYVGED